MYHTLFVLGAGRQRCIPTLFVLSVNRVSVNRVSVNRVSVNRVSVNRGVSESCVSESWRTGLRHVVANNGSHFENLLH
jgi:hypothetical protein